MERLEINKRRVRMPAGPIGNHDHKTERQSVSPCKVRPIMFLHDDLSPTAIAST